MITTEIAFIFTAYVAGTAFGYFWGCAKGHKDGIIDTIDSLVEKGYLKFKGTKNNPEIMKHEEEY